MGDYVVKVEEAREGGNGKASAGPVYRCIYAKDGLLEVPQGMDSPWEFFRYIYVYVYISLFFLHAHVESVKKNPNNQMLGRRQNIDGKAGAYNWQTYQQAYEETLKIGSAIRRRGVNPGDKCGIYGANSPEWIMTMEACNSHSITYVPLYDTLGANAVEFIIKHAEVSIVFVQESKLSAILTCLPNCVTHLKTIVSFGSISDKQKEAAEELGVTCFSWEEFSLLGDLEGDLPPKKKTDTCTIMYTSGTTGEPKGVILSNGAFMAEVLSVDQLLQLTDKVATGEDVYFSFLPLAHIFDQIIETYCIYRGASIGFWQGDIRFLIEDLLVLKPTIFCGVPRVFDRIYTGIMDKISGGGLLKKSLFQFAYNYKLRNLENGFKTEEASPLMDKLVFDKIKQAFGGRVRLILSGAAPLPKHIEEFLRVTCCCLLSQGYGLTESCAGCFTSIADVFPMMGSVGVPMTTIEARLESVPEMGYDALSNVPRGDIGEWQPNGAMKIIDRKKNIFKLSQGEYVAIECIESTYSRCPLITSIWVYGNSFESFLVAVVVPERKALEEWAENNKESGDFKSLCSNKKARIYILDELNSTAKTHNLRGFEMLRAVHLEPIPFDIERDLITPTFKLKRPQLLKYYQDCIDQLYSESKGTKA
ncbi:hypothetical protein BUALT_Bualt15G0030300 [Buddleja alternifolia]|uniref:Long-chain-fatty-acid--CoA ligase n=1 Tax=Buddleja alternifolia TaxID=168488 RepID=A0AAV6WCC7_9LAMI|nr:hypothetical protein BUALT_Bualt15G0030300 [Buddleja alternifolia]